LVLSGCLVRAVLSRGALSWQPWSWQSCPGCPLWQSFQSVLLVLFCLSCAVLTILFCCPVLPILFCLSLKQDSPRNIIPRDFRTARLPTNF
jgi:hypothetical protein